MKVMTPDNKRWDEFCSRLEGPEGCDFKEDPDKKYTWRCGGGLDKTFAIAILKDMGFKNKEIDVSLAYFEHNGGMCDCEILFNVDR